MCKKVLSLFLSVLIVFMSVFVPYQDANAVFPALALAAPETIGLVLTGLAACGLIAYNPDESYALYADFCSWCYDTGLNIADVINGVKTYDRTVEITPAYISYVDKIKQSGLIKNDYNLLAREIISIPVMKSGEYRILDTRYYADFISGKYRLSNTLTAGNYRYRINFGYDAVVVRPNVLENTFITLDPQSNTATVVGRLGDSTTSTTNYFDYDGNGLAITVQAENTSTSDSGGWKFNYDVYFKPVSTATQISVPTNVIPKAKVGDIVKVNTAVRPLSDYTVANVDAIMADVTISDSTVPVDPPVDGKINWEPLKITGALFTTKFPFSLPWDILRTFKALFIDNPTLPKWEVKWHDQILKKDFAFTIDISRYDTFFKIARGFVFVGFVVGLVTITRKLLGGAT